MNSYREDVARIQRLIGNSFSATGALAELVDDSKASKRRKTLEHTVGGFEVAAVELRRLCERYIQQTSDLGSKAALPYREVTGSVELLDYQWLHIRINTLLPSAAYQTPVWFSDTIRRLLDEFERGGRSLPYFKQALMVIDEHSDVTGRRAFDQDIPDYRQKLSRAALKAQYAPAPDEVLSWDAMYEGKPFVVAADMELRRLDAAIRAAQEKGLSPVSMIALKPQFDEVLRRRYREKGLARVFTLKDDMLRELGVSLLYKPPQEAYRTEKGEVIDAPLIQAARKGGGSGNQVVLTPFGLVTTAVIALLACLMMKKGYSRFSGYKYTHDSRGFDILPDATHGSSGFLTEKEMREFLELGTVREVTGMMLGKTKRHPDDPDKYALYVAHPMRAGDNNNLLCIGAPGSGKSRGFIIPFLMGVARRKESVIVTDPKGELFEKLSPYFREHGHYVKAVNFLDMEHSDGWNCLYGLDTETQLVQTVANTIIANTSGSNESDDFWSRAELNLLMAMLHYVANLKDDHGNLLPIEQRGLGKIYEMLSKLSIAEINRVFAELPSDHPARGPYGLFLKARENLWGNIIIGLGNRLAIFQSQLVDKITRNHDVDLTRPGKEPCAYFVIISAQDSTYRFLSSLFFSLAIPQLSDYARLHCEGGRLPVLVNFCLDEYCNIGYMDGMADALNSIRGFNMSCQIVVQSLSQWQEKYPGKEWENQLATFSQTMYLGCNDLASAKYISEKCGKVTISVTNNQMPLMPLFSPVYTSTRPYSQTRSNTARELMQQDEVLRLDNKKCIALFQGHKPALLYKLTPEELPDYATLKSCRIIDYTPEWKLREQEQEKQQKEKTTKQDLPKEPAEPTKPQTAEDLPEQDFDIIGDASDAAVDNDLGMQECGADIVVGMDDPDLPPR